MSHHANGHAPARPLHVLQIAVVQAEGTPNHFLQLTGDAVDDLGLALDILEDAQRAVRQMHRERRQKGIIKPPSGLAGV